MSVSLAEKQGNKCSTQKRRRRGIVLLLAALFSLLAGCGGSVKIGEKEISPDTERLDLNGAGVTSIYQLKRLKELDYLDLRNNDIQPAQYDELKSAIPDCEVLWSVPLDKQRIDSNATRIQDPDLTLRSAEMFAYFPALKTIDASGSRDYETLRTLADNYPQYTFLWSVTLNDQQWPNTAHEITVSQDPIDETALNHALSGFLNLQKVSFSGAAATQDLVTRLKQQFPKIDFVVGVSIAGKTFASDANTIDLSGELSIDLAALKAAIPQFEQLKNVNLRGCNLSIEERKSLLNEFPAQTFLWTLEILPGIVADSEEETLVLSDNIVADPEALAQQLEVLPGLTSVEMCNCGLTNEQMQALRERFPQIKFIWLIRVGDWELRTDVQAFSLANVKDFPGGRLVGDAFWRYHNFTEDSLVNLKYCTDLIALDIGHASNVRDLENLASLTKLQFLIVAMTRDTDIEVIRNMPDLVFLEIFSMPITDLSPLLSCKKLEYLNCGNCKFKRIDELVQMKQLKRLWIIGSKLNDDQLDQIKAALPDTLIRIGGEHPTDNGWRRDNPRYFEMRALFHLGK